MPFQIKITVFTYSLESGRADGFLFLRRKISYIIRYFLFLLNYLPWKRPHTEARVFSAGANRLWVCRLYLNVLSKNIYKNNNNNKKIEKYFQKRLRVPWETLSLTEIKSVITFNTNRKKRHIQFTPCFSLISVLRSLNEVCILLQKLFCRVIDLFG